MRQNGAQLLGGEGQHEREPERQVVGWRPGEAEARQLGDAGVEVADEPDVREPWPADRTADLLE